ncbi:lipoprotein [compost metagenome]
MSGINNAIENRLKAVRQDARFRPAIDQVKAANRQGVTSNELLDVAVKATVDEYKASGRRIDADQVRQRAFLAAAAAAAETPIQLSDLPEGDDKTKHFFVSGLISIKVAEVADKLLPRGLAEKIGTGASIFMGWGKEVYDKFFATGYNRDDLKADVAGAKRPFEVKVPGN